MSKYKKTGAEIGKLVESKQAAYGDSFGRSGSVMRLLYPNGIKPEQYDDALGVVRVLDKLFRIANHRDAFGESPWRDICGYGLLGAVRTEKRSPVSATTRLAVAACAKFEENLKLADEIGKTINMEPYAMSWGVKTTSKPKKRGIKFRD